MHTRAPGSRIGRYVVSQVLGAGGMGVVYKAHDPDLGRDVALKVMAVKRSAAGNSGRDRLVREAQALARLDHPNVVAVHDVGTHEDGVFVAMELADGKTLTDWLRDEKPTYARILEVLIAAGRGLAAAHRAGLVHRDFKPDNLIVGGDGRVRVIDFGLARSAFTSHDSDPNGTPVESPARPSVEESGSLLGEQLTLVGSIIGTPGYMAPEQYAGGDISAATDQFSFCVTLFRALYGERPFRGTTLDELRRSVIAGRIVFPESSSVPSRVRRLIVKGLATAPKDRHSSMDVLLRELARDPRVSSRRALAISGAVVLIGALVWWSVQRPDPPDPCASTPRRLAGVWDDGVSRAIQTAFAATGSPFAEDVHRQTAAALGRYADGWTTLATQTCKQTQHAAKSQLVLARRTECLDRRLSELSALTDVFAHAASHETVDRAVTAALALSDLAACDDDASLLAAVPPPEKTEAPRVEALRKRLARAQALDRTGEFDESAKLALEITNEARDLAYRPFLAEALLLQSGFYARVKAFKQAEPIVREQIKVAAQAGDDDMIARGWITLLATLVRQNRFAEADGLEAVADIAITRARGDELLRAELLRSVGALHYEKGAFDKAIEAYRTELALREKHQGKDHPQTLSTCDALGSALFRQGKGSEARPLYERVLAFREKYFGPNHLYTSQSLHNLGIAYYEEGRLPEARKLLERALHIDEKAVPDSVDLATDLQNLANLLVALHDHEAAQRYAERAVAIMEKELGPAHSGVGEALTVLADSHLGAGHLGDAIALYRRALTILEKAVGEHITVAYALTGLAEAYYRQDQFGLALEPLEHAYRIRATQPDSAKEVARTDFLLARTLWNLGRDRSRALDLARKADAIYAKDAPEARAEVAAWLKLLGGAK